MKAITKQYTFSGQLLGEFVTLKEASECTGVSAGNISNCLKKGSKFTQAGGYLWARGNEDVTTLVKLNKSKELVYQWSTKGILVGVHATMKAAQDATGVSSSNICGFIRGDEKGSKNLQAGGYLWTRGEVDRDKKVAELVARHSVKQAIRQWTLGGSCVGTFVNMTEASKESGVSVPNISRYLKTLTTDKPASHAGGFKWTRGTKTSPTKVKYSKVGRRVKSVTQWSLTGAKINTFVSITQASVVTGVAQANISSFLNGGWLGHAGGFLWTRSSDSWGDIKERLDIYRNGKAKSQISQWDLNGKLVTIHDSMAEASRVAGVSASNLSAYIRSLAVGEIKYRELKGFLWSRTDSDITGEILVNAGAVLHQYTRDLTFYIGSHVSIAKAGRTSGVNRCLIDRVLRGQASHAGGFYWTREKVTLKSS